MDILIKGMKMPKNCDECRIMVFEDTNCAPELYCGCPIVFQAHPQGVGNRPNYCPLIPLPKHGRLKDYDRIMKEYDEWFSKTESREYENMFYALKMAINGSPTIIPADTQKEE